MCSKYASSEEEEKEEEEEEEEEAEFVFKDTEFQNLCQARRNVGLESSSLSATAALLLPYCP